MRIFVGGLTDHLANITESDIRQLLPLGDIEYIDMQSDPSTGKCKGGYIYIQFRRESHAKEAISLLDGFNYKGKKLKVGEARDDFDANFNASLATGRDLDDERNGLINNAQSRQIIMNKLNRDTLVTTNQNTNPNYTYVPYGNVAPIQNQGMQSTCVLFSNMFDPANINLSTDPTFYDDIEEDVKGKLLMQMSARKLEL